MMMMICTLEGFVEVETEVGKDHPELLPPVRVLELSEDNTDVIFSFCYCYYFVDAVAVLVLLVFDDILDSNCAVI